MKATGLFNRRTMKILKATKDNKSQYITVNALGKLELTHDINKSSTIKDYDVSAVNAHISTKRTIVPVPYNEIRTKFKEDKVKLVYYNSRMQYMYTYELAHYNHRGIRKILPQKGFTYNLQDATVFTVNTKDITDNWLSNSIDGCINYLIVDTYYEKIITEVI